MRKKGIAIWVFTTLTFIAFIHLIDAASALIFNNSIQLLQIYPFINTQSQQMPIDIYLYLSATLTAILWAITCLIAFDNPVEEFLNKILSDAKKQTTTEAQVLESKSELFDLMYETVESDSETLAQVKDLMHNMRAEVKDIQPIKETIEKTRAELSNLKKQMKTLEEKLLFTILCPACGKLVRPDFKLCPYCGESIPLQEKMVVVKDYKK
ncbi:MAG: zinc-ribbon domain-containing protein [Candidatus Bathyarchaeota archaeon]|nr:MAG: zinc-ribbon domain-containing protein [Candidatus Bathyarchaeota archaeon]